MPPVRFILLALACSASITHAGAIISIVDPQDPGPVGYEPGQIVRFDVFAQLDSNGPPSIGLRELQFGLSATSVELAVTTALTHPGTKSHGDILFWDFSAAPRCASDSSACGDFHFIIDTISPPSNVLALVYTGLTDSPNRLITLTQAAQARVGVLEVTMPMDPGIFILDVLNANEQEFRNFGGFMRFGFDTIVDWSAYQGQITGGQHRFFVGVPEPATLALLLLGTACLTTRRGG